MSADAVGYSKLMGDDELATVETLTKYRDVFGDHIARHEGRVDGTPSGLHFFREKEISSV